MRSTQIVILGATLAGISLGFYLLKNQGLQALPQSDTAAENLASSQRFIPSETGKRKEDSSENSIPGAANPAEAGDEEQDLSYLYENAVWAAPGKFETTPLPLNWDFSCDSLQPKEKFSNLSQHLISRGLNGSWKYPSETHVLDWNQFFQWNGEYYQLSALWEIDDPATYRIQAVKNTSMEPSESMTELPTGFDKPLSQQEAISALKKIEAEWIKKGARAGARTMIIADQVFHPERNIRNSVITAEFVNGDPIHVSLGQVNCSQSSTEILCRCMPQMP